MQTPIVIMDSAIGRDAMVAALGDVLSSDVTILTYIELASLSTDDDFPINIQVHEDYEDYSPTELLTLVNERASLLQEFASQCFYNAKNGIVEQTINCTLSGDMGNLNMDDLIEYNENIQQRFISNNGLITVAYRDGEWVSQDNCEFEFAVHSDYGYPVIEDYDEYELDDGTFTTIDGFVRVEG